MFAVRMSDACLLSSVRIKNNSHGISTLGNKQISLVISSFCCMNQLKIITFNNFLDNDTKLFFSVEMLGESMLMYHSAFNEMNFNF